MQSHKFRCSSLGKLMTKSRKAGELSKTTQSYLNELYYTIKYGFQPEIQSKYIEKGLMCENASLALFSEVDDNLYLKNDEYFENDYIAGTPDLVEDKVYDIKTSWGIETYANADIKPMYYWQLQGYMWLTGLKKAELVYCLVDTPDQLIADERRRFAWKMNVIDDSSEEFVNAWSDVESQMVFSHIPKEERVKRFEIEYNEKDIEALKVRVEECRTYLNNL